MIENMARPCPPPGTITITITTIILLLVSLEPTIGAPDDEALLKFKGSLEIGNDALASWAAGSPPCSGDKGNWVGILCEKGNVWGLKLENMGLKGTVDIESLEGAPQLRTISLMGNDFEGPLPDVKRLGALKSLYLSRNRFSGEIPGDKFSSMLSLKKVHLAQNQLEGQIPWSLVELPRLMELRLEGNKFSGQIPNFHQKGLKSFNISNNNQLHGPIPSALAQIDPTSFSGDDGLCGPPLNKSCNTQKMPSIASIVMVSIAVTAALLAIGAGIVILSRRNQSSPSIEDPAQNKSPGANDMDPAVGSRSPDRGSSHGSLGKRAGDNAKLSFVREDSERFDMSDLLKASAEILGSGCFGSSYKAALTNGPVMVVKRFKQMNNVDKEEFQEHMRRIGRLKHPNLLPIVAYYYKKEEKLLITDYIEKGSLAVHLHGHQAVGQPALDWPARLKIVKGVAKGLRYLYTELPSLISAHGHLKSSNVLLKASNEPVLSDYGLIPVVNQEHAQELMVAYKSPEYSQQGRITKKTDVWSFGLLILEILTGKFPANFLHQGKGGDEEDLATWVKAIPEKDWSTQVFDKDMGPTKNCEAEMLKLLRIAMTCCESDFEKRLDLREAVDKIEELKEKDGDEDFYSSYASEADIRSSRGLSDELNFTL
ncbi:pollen receptor-like kinase 1 isoform X2 [Momordica charantia]|uniref:non-specific serine/threonine protein kinase n=1 Tax=Momordica charantia TaxID=3673 RepID=A0A6J1C0Z6_MOMCH|nr:pollen receptor-like kinase 1 isoform X2 [Momordica charantia]